MSHQIGSSGATGRRTTVGNSARERVEISATERLTVVRDASGAPSPRDRAARLLRDPKGYFVEARQWAGRVARADVQRELSEREARRGRRSLLRRLGFAGR